jgi:hypothetical protein
MLRRKWQDDKSWHVHTSTGTRKGQKGKSCLVHTSTDTKPSSSTVAGVLLAAEAFEGRDTKRRPPKPVTTLPMLPTLVLQALSHVNHSHVDSSSTLNPTLSLLEHAPLVMVKTADVEGKIPLGQGRHGYEGAKEKKTRTLGLFTWNWEILEANARHRTLQPPYFGRRRRLGNSEREGMRSWRGDP